MGFNDCRSRTFVVAESDTSCVNPSNYEKNARRWRDVGTLIVADRILFRQRQPLACIRTHFEMTYSQNNMPRTLRFFNSCPIRNQSFWCRHSISLNIMGDQFGEPKPQYQWSVLNTGLTDTATHHSSSPSSDCVHIRDISPP